MKPVDCLARAPAVDTLGRIEESCVTEQDWMDCADPRELLAFLGDRVSGRKVSLFACACCRILWGASPDPGTQTALSVAEHISEVRGLRRPRMTFQIAARRLVLDCGASEPPEQLEVRGDDGNFVRVDPAVLRSGLAAVLEVLGCRDPILRSAGWFVSHFHRLGLDLPLQAEVFRDIVRGPFRPLLFRAAWREYGGGLLAQLADSVYVERAPETVSVLADALDDAGCADLEILDHLRGPGPHWRGCWAIDVCLGRS